MKEELDDEIFNEIYNMCLNYIQSSKISDELSNEHLHIAFDFIKKKYNEICSIKKSFKIKEIFSPFTNIGESLDDLTLRNITGKSEDYILYILSKDINNLLKNLKFCYITLDKMILERL